MSLINCPECNHEISDKAEVCIHCGFPIKEYILRNDGEYTLDYFGRKIDLSHAYELINQNISPCIWMRDECGIDEKYLIIIYRDIKNHTIKHNIEEYDQQLRQRAEEAQRKQQEEQAKIAQKEAMKPKCPTCGSTNIRKISNLSRSSSFLVHGLASSKMGKTMECLNPKCGYKW